MLFQIWLTILTLVFGALGAFWLLVRRPLLRRIQSELELEREERLRAEREAEARKAAEAEVEAFCNPVPDEKAQQEERLG